MCNRIHKNVYTSYCNLSVCRNRMNMFEVAFKLWIGGGFIHLSLVFRQRVWKCMLSSVACQTTVSEYCICQCMPRMMVADWEDLQLKILQPHFNSQRQPCSKRESIHLEKPRGHCCAKTSQTSEDMSVNECFSNFSDLVLQKALHVTSQPNAHRSSWSKHVIWFMVIHLILISYWESLWLWWVYKSRLVNGWPSRNIGKQPMFWPWHIWSSCVLWCPSPFEPCTKLQRFQNEYLQHHSRFQGVWLPTGKNEKAQSFLSTRSLSHLSLLHTIPGFRSSFGFKQNFQRN